MLTLTQKLWPIQKVTYLIFSNGYFGHGPTMVIKDNRQTVASHPTYTEIAQNPTNLSSACSRSLLPLQSKAAMFLPVLTLSTLARPSTPPVARMAPPSDLGVGQIVNASKNHVTSDVQLDIQLKFPIFLTKIRIFGFVC